MSECVRLPASPGPAGLRGRAGSFRLPSRASGRRGLGETALPGRRIPRAQPALGGAGFLASSSLGCPAQGCPGRGRSRPVGGAGAEKAGQGDGSEAPATIGPWRPLPALREPETGTPCLPRRSRQDPSLPFTPVTPRTLQTSCPRRNPQLRVPASRPGHVRPAPRARAPPRGRSQPPARHLAERLRRVRARGPGFLSGSPPPLFPPSRRPTRPDRFSSRAGGAARSGRGIGECHPSPGQKPFRDP